jgi:protein ImuB
MPHQQADAWESSEQAHDAQYTCFLDSLVNRWGKDRVLTAHAVASHTPEVARQFVPAGEEPVQAEVQRVDRPSVLFDRPECAEGMALQPDHPPAWIRWRGEDYPLEAGIGPERIVTAWWSASYGSRHRRASTRDYFKVQTKEATWLWVFREQETGQWFVHGIWA